MCRSASSGVHGIRLFRPKGHREQYAFRDAALRYFLLALSGFSGELPCLESSILRNASSCRPGHRVLLGNKALQTSILAILPSAAWQRPFASIFCASDSVEKAIAAAAAERLARQAERERS